MWKRLQDEISVNLAPASASLVPQAPYEKSTFRTGPGNKAMPQLLELSLYYDLEKASADFTLSLPRKSLS